MHIKQITVKNLWQRGDIVWDLSDDVNVLVGNNGSGKSTILNLVYEALQPEISEDAKKRYFGLIAELVIRFEDDTFVIVDSSGDRFPSKLEFFETDVSRVATFDVPDSLDEQIKQLLIKFETYQKHMFKKMVELARPGNQSIQSDSINKLIGSRNNFVTTVNQLFSESGKAFSEEHNTFKLDNQQNELTHEKLSSGEKQVFAILLQMLLQEEKPAIILLDEPEISLHIEWQRELLTNMRKLNENCQIIAVTHSSNMFSRGWIEHVKNIDDIRTSGVAPEISFVDDHAFDKFEEELSNITSYGSLPARILSDANQLIHRCFFRLTLRECTEIIQKLTDNGIVPDHFTFTTLISKSTTMNDAESLLAVMRTKRIQPNGVTYVNILKKTNSFEEAKGVFNRMREAKIEPAIQHFSTLLGKAQTSEAAQEVEELRSLFGVDANEIYQNKLRMKK
jgi:pentatricopeptide repeat protein